MLAASPRGSYQTRVALRGSHSYLLLALIALLAAALDLHRLGAQTLWRDEALSVAIARMPVGAFVQFVSGYEPFMSAYVLLLRGWLHLGQAEFPVRLLSVIFAVATVIATFVLGRLLFDERAGLASALLLAINSFSIQYAQEARAYTLVSLAVVCSWISLLTLVKQSRRTPAVCYILTTALLGYCNIIAITTLPAQWIAIILFRPSRRTMKYLIISTGMIIVLVTPSVILIFAASLGQGTWIQRPDLFALVHLAERFLNLPAVFTHSAAPFTIELCSEAAIALVFVLLASIGAAQAGFRSDRQRLLAYACAALGAVVPIALVFLVSQLKPLFVPRYMFFCLPFFVLFIAAGLLEFRRLSLVAIAFTGLIVLNLWADWRYYKNPYKPDWKSAIASFSSTVRSGDAVALVEAFSRWPFDYNWTRYGASAANFVIIFPKWDRLFRVDGQYPNSAMMMRPNPALMTALAPLRSRLWIISEDPKRKEDPVFRTLKARYQYCYRSNFRRISITLYTENAVRDSGAPCNDERIE
jgi:mannosyltransferase